MNAHFILYSSLLAFWWLLRRDSKLRKGVSGAIWIPTLWAGILCSRQLSAWLGVSGGIDTLEGSPIDRFFFLAMIILSALILARRRAAFAAFIAENWSVVIFYGFLLCSVAWANEPMVSFKRWFKESGNILIALVILTEANPLEAIRAVFVRCGMVLIPLSLIFVRYLPHLGRTYNVHTGEVQVTGVTFQKNTLGTMILVCGLVTIWDWLERTRPGASRLRLIERLWIPTVLVLGLYLLWLSDSKTSIVGLLLGAGIITAVRLPMLRRRINAIGIYLLVTAVGFFLLDWAFGLTRAVIANLGRDMTFTGRTDVWRELLAVGTDPIFGTGYMSFWDDARYRSILPNWVAFSAHNGYLEVYLAGGLLGVSALCLMLFVNGVRVHQALATGTSYAVVRFAVFCVVLVANFSESNFACMTPLGLLFLIAAIGHARSYATLHVAAGMPSQSQEEATATMQGSLPMCIAGKQTGAT